MAAVFGKQMPAVGRQIGQRRLACLPAEMMLDSLNVLTPWLPTSMAIELFGPLFLNNQLSEDVVFAGIGLAVYMLLFAMISVKKVQWEA